MKNRGDIPTARIAEKLQQVQNQLNIASQKSFLNNPLLFINGRLNRKSFKYIAKNFALLESIDEEIKKYCKGIDLTILNYLIYRGLASLKEDNKFTSIEYSDIEKHFKSFDN